MEDRTNGPCGFYGAENASEEVRELYRDLRQVWCLETCSPGLRSKWSETNPSLGQCSITALLVQEMLGGKVYGIPLPDGAVHCYNVIDDTVVDLASEQFGGKVLHYDCRFEQSRDAQFADSGKHERYELLRERLAALRAER